MPLLPRLQLVELHELPWMPDVLRHGTQRSITFNMLLFGCFRKGVPGHFARWLERTGATEVLDIGSGSGGPIVSLIHGLRKQGIEPPTFFLSDLYPETTRYAALSQREPTWADGDTQLIRYIPEPVDALADPLPCPQQCFTLINIAHHFPPPLLKRILANLVRQGRGIFIIECLNRSLRYATLLIGSLVGSWGAPLFMRPWSWSHFLFATALPLVPVIMMLDGYVSVLRSYTLDEWRQMVAELDADGYDWEIDSLPTGGVYAAGWRR